MNAPLDAISCLSPLVDLPSWWTRRGLITCIDMGPLEVGFVTAQYAIGGLLGSWIGGVVSDRIGRRRACVALAWVYLLGSGLETFAGGVGMLGAGRHVAGIGAGGSLVNSPLILNEIARGDARGRLGTMNQVFVNLGIFLTQCLALKYAYGDQWRWLLFVGMLLAVCNLVLALLAVETPKWLVKKGRVADAKTVLAALRGNDENVEAEIEEWQHEVVVSAELLGSEAPPPSFLSYLRSSEYSRSRNIAASVMSLQQLSGVPAIMFYGVNIISQILPDYAMAINCGLSFLNGAFTVVSGVYIDRVGRTMLLLISGSAMFAANGFLALGILQGFRAVAVTSIFVFISAFAVGMGPIPFLYISEVTQLQATTVAQSFGTGMNWVVTILIGWIFPVVSEAIGGYVFFIFAANCAVLVVLVWRYFPETKGKKGYAEVWNID